jgi:hypothetical protein
MNVAREVILDLLPIYLSGEASAATRALVDEYLQQDPELAKRMHTMSAESLHTIAQAPLPTDIELRSLRRARALIGWQKWLFGLGITFTALALPIEFSFEEGRLSEFHFLIRDYPKPFGYIGALALVCWISYYAIRRRLRITR